MSKYNQGYLGAQIGKLGNGVGRMWKGRPVMSVYQPNVANPRTSAQQIVRARFGRLAKLSSAFYAVLLQGLGIKARQYRITEGNAFISENWPNVTAVSPDDVTVNYPSLQIARGNLPMFECGAVNFGSTTHLHLEASLTGGADQWGASENDDIYMVAYCPELNQSALGSGSKRSAEKVSVNVPASWDGMEVYVYAFGMSDPNSRTRQCSNTLYCGSGEVC